MCKFLYEINLLNLYRIGYWGIDKTELYFYVGATLKLHYRIRANLFIIHLEA